MSLTPKANPLRWMFERIPDACLIETDASGLFTHFGPAAETFFNCPASEALGQLHYRTFHDPVEMEACRDDPGFQARMRDEGWTEDDWTIRPRNGAAFKACVTLVRAEAPGDADTPASPGWIAFYRRVSAL